MLELGYGQAQPVSEILGLAGMREFAIIKDLRVSLASSTRKSLSRESEVYAVVAKLWLSGCRLPPLGHAVDLQSGDTECRCRVPQDTAVLTISRPDACPSIFATEVFPLPISPLMAQWSNIMTAIHRIENVVLRRSCRDMVRACRRTAMERPPRATGAG